VFWNKKKKVALEFIRFSFDEENNIIIDFNFPAFDTEVTRNRTALLLDSATSQTAALKLQEFLLDWANQNNKREYVEGIINKWMLLKNNYMGDSNIGGPCVRPSEVFNYQQAK